MEFAQRWPLRFAIVAVMLTLTFGPMLSGSVDAQGGHVCVSELGVLVEQRGRATCFSDATSTVSVTGIGSHAEGRNGSTVVVSGNRNSVMVSSSNVTVSGQGNEVGGEDSSVDIDGNWNAVVTFSSTVTIDGGRNSLFDTVTSTVALDGNSNFGQMVNTTLMLDGNNNTLTTLDGCSIIVAGNRIVLENTCVVP
ncbi:MAG: hypothetical protein AB7V46_07190 [Thermomicrobiales bacterium]